jgi:dTDP-4-dehydrorhamnose 3,5-epimerase
MRIVPGAFEGVYLLDIEPREDSGGLQARTFSADELDAFGLQTRIAQIQIVFSPRPGTVRGLYHRRPPGRAQRGAAAPDTRIVRCTRGRVFDVIVDLRPDSRTFKQWDAIELSEHNHRSIYLPEGFAHGYQILSEGAELLYLLSGPHPAEPPAGVRPTDPELAVAWPEPVTHIAPRDLAFPLLESW